jgi:hypothetical protein
VEIVSLRLDINQKVMLWFKVCLSQTNRGKLNMGGVSNWTTSTNEMSGVMKIEHSYWGNWSGATPGTGYVRGVIKFTNVSEIPIQDVKIYLDLDDTSVTWDAIIVDSGGTPVPEGVIDLGPVAPGKYAEKKYWWSLRHLFGPTKEEFEVKFNIIPEFKLAYTKNDAFQDTAKVSAV